MRGQSPPNDSNSNLNLNLNYQEDKIDKSLSDGKNDQNSDSNGGRDSGSGLPAIILDREIGQKEDSFSLSSSLFPSLLTAKAHHTHRTHRTHNHQSQANCLFFVDPCTTLELMSPSSQDPTQVTVTPAVSAPSIPQLSGGGDKEIFSISIFLSYYKKAVEFDVKFSNM